MKPMGVPALSGNLFIVVQSGLLRPTLPPARYAVIASLI